MFLKSSCVWLSPIANVIWVSLVLKAFELPLRILVNFLSGSQISFTGTCEPRSSWDTWTYTSESFHSMAITGWRYVEQVRATTYVLFISYFCLF